jgi:hypothetical protein
MFLEQAWLLRAAVARRRRDFEPRDAPPRPATAAPAEVRLIGRPARRRRPLDDAELTGVERALEAWPEYAALAAQPLIVGAAAAAAAALSATARRPHGVCGAGAAMSPAALGRFEGRAHSILAGALGAAVERYKLCSVREMRFRVAAADEGKVRADSGVAMGALAGGGWAKVGILEDIAHVQVRGH